MERVEVKGHTVGECLEAVIRRFPEIKGEIFNDEGLLLLRWALYVTREDTSRPAEMGDGVREGEEIQLVPLIDGG